MMYDVFFHIMVSYGEHGAMISGCHIGRMSDPEALRTIPTNLINQQWTIIHTEEQPQVQKYEHVWHRSSECRPSMVSLSVKSRSTLELTPELQSYEWWWDLASVYMLHPIKIASSDQVKRQQWRDELVRENTHLVLDTLASRLRELLLNCRSWELSISGHRIQLNTSRVLFVWVDETISKRAKESQERAHDERKRTYCAIVAQYEIRMVSNCTRL